MDISTAGVAMSPAARIGEYRIKRQIHGSGAFTHVRVELRPADSAVADPVHWAVDPTDLGSAQPIRYPEEVRAALAGAEGALDDLDRIGVDTSGQAVHVTLLGINVVDTEPTAVRAAATAATAAAFGADDRFTLIYADGRQYRPAGPAQTS
jgi:hypothetical protein